MAKKTELIKLDDIKCNFIVEQIKECTSIVFKFRETINEFLEYRKLLSPQIYIMRTLVKAFENDGNTTTAGYKYEIYWCFKYINVEKKLSIPNIENIKNDIWPDYTLFFKFSVIERVRDHKYQKGYFFKLYLTDENEISTTEKENLVVCYNENHKLRDILKVNNLYFCIKKINKVYHRLLLKEQVLEKLCENTEIPKDIEKYIIENSEN